MVQHMRIVSVSWREAKDESRSDNKEREDFHSGQKQAPGHSLAVKDGKFVYVGDEAGLSEYEGEVRDLGGRFIMPGIIDSHVHVTMGAGFEYTEVGPYVDCDSKQGADGRKMN